MSNFVPIRQYNKNQAIVTSDRIIFNTKDDNIFLISKKDVAISSGGDVHIDVGPSGGTSNMLVVNAPKIKLGINNVQPVPMGDNLNNVLNQLMKALSQLASNLETATGFGVGTVTTPTINAAGTTLSGQVTNIQSLIKQINSTVTFTS